MVTKKQACYLVCLLLLEYLHCPHQCLTVPPTLFPLLCGGWKDYRVEMPNQFLSPDYRCALQPKRWGGAGLDGSAMCQVWWPFDCQQR